MIASPSPAAHAACRCGWWQAGRGRERVLAVIAAHEDHKATCGAAVPTAAAAARRGVVDGAERLLRGAA